jgi:hypothetical protein
MEDRFERVAIKTLCVTGTSMTKFAATGAAIPETVPQACRGGNRRFGLK